MFTFLKQTQTLLFIGGAVVGSAGSKLLKSESARNFAVNALAKGYQIKDVVMEQVSNIRQEAEDICAEAKDKNKTGCGCGCDCGPECTCHPVEVVDEV